MSFESGPRPRPARRWSVRLFETSDKLEEHLNKSDLRPEQVASINVDGDGFFVLVYWMGPPPAPRPPMRPAFEERRPPPPRRRFEDESEERGFDDGPQELERPRRTFEREGFPQRRPMEREGFPPRRPGGPPRRRER